MTIGTWRRKALEVWTQCCWWWEPSLGGKSSLGRSVVGQNTTWLNETKSKSLIQTHKLLESNCSEKKNVGFTSSPSELWLWGGSCCWGPMGGGWVNSHLKKNLRTTRGTRRVRSTPEDWLQIKRVRGAFNLDFWPKLGIWTNRLDPPAPYCKYSQVWGFESI